MELTNVCMDCGFEWGDNRAIRCVNCGSGDFFIDNEFEYNDLSIEDCFTLYHEDKYFCQFDGDNKQIIVIEEE